jgi:Protein of unknown function (DUF3144)
MPINASKDFYDRADGHIHVANEQLTPKVRPEEVSASMTFALARFNAWMAAHSCVSAAALKESKADTIAYFVSQFQEVLEENMDDYVKNFERYTQRKH